jgi:NAD(P)-dependent dehydrogenase (short-subunit alcohol dehydrogenase family)
MLSTYAPLLGEGGPATATVVDRANRYIRRVDAISFAPGALAGRVAIVTGGASGIGAATARLLAELGAGIAILDINRAGSKEVAEDIRRTGGAALTYPTDVSALGELEATVAETETALGAVTIVVNNAGVTGTPLMETSTASWERVLRINLTAPFVLTQAVGRRMIAGGRGGSIVNVSSSSAFRAVSSGGPYGVSKAGLGALTRGAAWELGPYGINVNAVAPGLTRTAITAGAFDEDGLQQAARSGPLANLLGRVSEPEDVANVIVFLCLPASRQITGQVIHASAGAVVAAG